MSGRQQGTLHNGAATWVNHYFIFFSSFAVNNLCFTRWLPEDNRRKWSKLRFFFLEVNVYEQLTSPTSTKRGVISEMNLIWHWYLSSGIYRFFNLRRIRLSVEISLKRLTIIFHLITAKSTCLFTKVGSLTTFSLLEYNTYSIAHSNLLFTTHVIINQIKWLDPLQSCWLSSSWRTCASTWRWSLASCLPANLLISSFTVGI